MFQTEKDEVDLQIIDTTYDLAVPSGRLPGTRGHREAAAYITHRFHSLALEPYAGRRYALPYTARNGTAMANIAAVVPGADRTLPPVLVGAHYDSVIDAPCADDNATSVAVMLDIARRTASSPIGRDVVFVAFDGEEPPYFLGPDMGSNRFVADHLSEVHAAVVMDLIGHPTALPDPWSTAITGIESHPDLAAVVAQDGAVPLLPIANSRVGDMSDHHAFRLAGHPFLFLSSGEWPDYHTRGDTPDKIDYGKVAAVADEVDRIVRLVDGLRLGPAVPWNIEVLERDGIARHVGAGALDRFGGRVDRLVSAVRSGSAGQAVVFR